MGRFITKSIQTTAVCNENTVSLVKQMFNDYCKIQYQELVNDSTKVK